MRLGMGLDGGDEVMGDHPPVESDGGLGRWTYHPAIRLRVDEPIWEQ